jgi:hypothetical protein
MSKPGCRFVSGRSEPVRRSRREKFSRLKTRDGDLEQPSLPEGAGLQQLAQGLALDQLHDDERAAGPPPDLVDGDDVGVVEGRGRTRLVLEAGEASSIGRYLGRELLDGDVPSELRIARAVDLAHAAGPEEADDLIPAEQGAGGLGKPSLPALSSSSSPV